MFNESFWILLSFIIFIILVFKPVKNKFKEVLDNRILSISKNIHEVQTLKNEAINLFNSAHQDKISALETANQIISKAEAEAQYIIMNAKDEALMIAKKRIDLAMQRIAIEESKFISDIKAEIMETAIKNIKNIILNELSQQSKLALIDRSINIIKKSVH